MATVDILVPDVIGDAEECVVVTWLKREGDYVREGEDLVVLQVEKVSYDVPSPVSGRLVAILVPQGQVARRGEALARVEVAEEKVPAGPAAEPTERPAAPPAASAREERILASPMAKRLAREHNIDLRQVKGTGRGGRITEKDVRAYIEAQQRAARETVIPMAGMRATIARRMVESLHTMAQVTLFTEADVTDLVALYERLKAEAPGVSYTDFVVRACALALREHPRLNAVLEKDVIRLLPDIHIGIAVALEDGLVVPVIRHADQKDIQTLVEVRQELVERARAGRLTQEEMSGSTFTVTNLGMYEIDGFTPIVNPPEVAILGVGRIVEKVVIHKGKIAQRAMMTLSLTFDHRVVDGAPAAAFLRTVKHMLETLSFWDESQGSLAE